MNVEIISQVEERLKFFDTGEQPRKNIDVMSAVATQLRKISEASEKEKAKSKKKSVSGSTPEPLVVKDDVDADGEKKKKKKSKKRDATAAEITAEDNDAGKVEEEPPKLKKAKKVFLIRP